MLALVCGDVVGVEAEFKGDAVRHCCSQYHC